MLDASRTDHNQTVHRMGHRLSKIVTRTGDTGSTGLGDGTRVPKDSARIEVISAVDELNSAIGVLLAEPLPQAIGACLVEVQHDLFDVVASCRSRVHGGARRARAAPGGADRGQ
jgi:cob(I)alamin adenosyltransferase